MDDEPGPAVLADFLALASEDGPEKLVETDRLLRGLAGDDVVNEAHREWTARLREGLAPGFDAGPEVVGETSPESWGLLRRLRAARPGAGVGRSR